ncbi:MAG: hypothetical protein KME17_24450 [Cyanosarcina radialis HA8281-LM2]|nr:hypothetical protein [Cyanosarcina radialis HA8281-LM2]
MPQVAPPLSRLFALTIRFPAAFDETFAAKGISLGLAVRSPISESYN